MDYRLTIDRGNTALKAALWRSDDEAEPFRLVSLPGDASMRDVQSVFAGLTFSEVAYSSVVMSCRPDDMSALASMSPHTVDVNSTVHLPFRNLYRTPQTLGADRIAALAGAIALCGGDAPGILVSDLGTAATYDYLGRDDAGFVYHGGNIAPGVPLRLLSLAQHTSALPAVSPELVPDGDIWGKSTRDALLNGAVFGVIAELQFYRRSCPDGTATVLTGGGAEYLVKNNLINFDYIYDPYLVMRGLNHIINENH